VKEEAGPGEKIATKGISRKHVIEISPSGLISLMGGKWTIYRRMGEDTVDEILKYLETHKLKPQQQILPSRTKNLRLVGDFHRESGEYYRNRKEYVKFYADILKEEYHLPVDVAKYLIRTYGDRAFDIAVLYFKDVKNRERIHENFPITVGEVRYNINYEMAASPIDVLFRRTRLGFLSSEAIYKVYPRLIDIYAEEWKWNDQVKKIQQEQYLEMIRKMNF